MIVSLVIVAISLKYGFDKFNTMINYDDTSYKEVREPGALDRHTTFRADEFDGHIAIVIGDQYSYLSPEQYEDYVTLSGFSIEIDYSNTDTDK